MVSNERWGEVLEQYQEADIPLFSTAVMTRWGTQPWKPSDDDRAAAGKLHNQVTSRITTQRLGYLDGDEQTALESVHSLFELTRKIVDEFHGCRHFDALAWDVLNTHVRPFTAKWHRESLRGALSALDATDEFRAKLDDLQEILRNFDDFLLHLRDGDDCPPPPLRPRPHGESDITKEIEQPVPWGIHEYFGGISNKDRANEINRAEKTAIEARRRQYGEQDVHKQHAIALALSGGGIRSATFSLGVLVALARRNILPQIDYLSTVSGGGYLGSFLTAYLSSPSGRDIGLERDKLPFRRKAGEAEALRHIRHHSKYLVTGSSWERIKIVCGQLYGMLLNSLGIALLIALLAGIERPVRLCLERQGFSEWGTLLMVGFGICAIAALLLLRLRQKSWWPLADRLVAVAIVVPLVFFVWHGLGAMHGWVDKLATPGGLTWSLGDPKTWVAVGGVVTGAIPVISSVFAGSVDRLLKRTGIIVVVLTAIAAPIFLFGLYLAIYHWVSCAETISVPWAGPMSRLQFLWTAVAAGLLAYYFVLDINFTSPHRYYRDKLAEAYLIRPAVKPNTQRGAQLSNSADSTASSEQRSTNKAGTEATPQQFDKAVSVRLSDLIEKDTGRAPYHLINCALNVPDSRNLRMQGRLTDFFLFSPAFCGSPLTGYWPTKKWETVDPHLDLGTVMAISGAAAAPQMGVGTVRRFSFWLALLNVRLGYWVRKPDTTKKDLWPYGGAPGLRFLIKEMLGTMNERLPWLNVSDGGHIENLGVYELLRRRCKYIIAVDGEQDAKMTFQALTTLQRLAAIDFGIQIDINLDDLRLNKKGLTRSHFHFCRIHYPIGDRDSEKMIGYLLYLKLSLTGNEGEFIRRYRLDEPAFPHHSTADQFFTEAQFEAYRTLGEHVGDKLFLRAIVGNDLGDSDNVNVEKWFLAMGNSLLEPRPELIRKAKASPQS